MTPARQILLTLLVIIVNVFNSPLIAQQQSCALTIPSTEWQVNGRENAASVKPGDTICLMAGSRQFLSISYLHGTSAKPIVVRNSNGIVDVSGYY